MVHFNDNIKKKKLGEHSLPFFLLLFISLCFIFFSFPLSTMWNLILGEEILFLSLIFFILDPIYFWFGHCFSSPCLIWWNASKPFDFHIRGLIWGPRMFLQPPTSTVWMHAFFFQKFSNIAPHAFLLWRFGQGPFEWWSIGLYFLRWMCNQVLLGFLKWGTTFRYWSYNHI